MDNQGNIDITAPNHIRFNSKEVTFNVADKMQFNVMQKMVVNTPWLMQLVTELYHTQAGKALFSSENEIKIESPELYATGQKKLFLHSDEVATINSKGVAEFKGQEGNKHSNVAEDYETQKPYIEAKGIIQFRVQSNYKGDFGFDWLRMGDMGTPGDEWYKDIIGHFYIIDSKTNKQRKAHDGEISKQKSIITTEIKEYTKITNVFNILSIGFKKDLYIIPYLSLMPNEKADLTLKIEIQEEPEDIKFVHSNNISVTINGSINKTKGKHTQANVFSIQAKTLKSNEYVDVMFINKAKEEQLAGRIRVLANDTKHQREVKVLFVQVRSELIKGFPKIGSPHSKGKIQLPKNLKQALINTAIEDAVIDMKGSTKFKTFTNGAKVNKLTGFHQFLRDELKVQHKKDYSNYYKVFFIGEPGDWNGAAENIGKGDSVVCFPGHNEYTIAHELMHVMGLYHSFSNKGNHTFDIGHTENVMDYSHNSKYTGKAIDRISTWFWQWKILNKNISR